MPATILTTWLKWHANLIWMTCLMLSLFTAKELNEAFMKKLKSCTNILPVKYIISHVYNKPFTRKYKPTNYMTCTNKWNYHNLYYKQSMIIYELQRIHNN